MAESHASRMATLAGGVSTLKPEVQSPGQVKLAFNADFSLQDGFAIRAGTRTVLALGSSIPSSVWLASKTLEGGEEPIALLGSDGSVRLLNTARSEVAVQIDPAVVAYLAASGTRRPHSASVDDDEGVLRIANDGVTPLATRSPVVRSSGSRDLYDALEAFTPATPGTIYEAKEGADGRPAGLYRYLPGVGTFSRAEFATYNASDTTGQPTALFNNINQNPRGFRLFACRYIVSTSTAVYSTAASAAGTIGLISGLSVPGYVWQAGDEIWYDGVAGGTAAAYRTTGYAGGVLYLETTISGPAPGNIGVRGIGKLVEITENFALNPVASMDDAAVRYTRALRAAGLINACVHWEWVNFSNYTGKFTITSSDGGPKAGFISAHCIHAPTVASAVADTAFAVNPTVTAGTGAWEDFTTVPRDRWLAVAAPDQADALLDPETMPVRLRKVDTTSYAETTLDLGAWHYWRLGDSTTNNTAKDSASHSLGTYTNSPTRGVAGFVSGDSDFATTFDGTNDYVAVTTWHAIGNRDAITVEMLLSTSTAGIGERCMFHMRQTNDLYVTMNKTAANRITVYTGGGEYYCDVTGLAGGLAFNNGTLRHLVVVATASAVRVEVDGVVQTMTTVSAATGNPGIAVADVAYTINIGRRQDNSQFFQGTLDEVAVYPFAFAAATATGSSLAAWRNLQARGSTSELWAVEQSPWTPRLTGDPLSNPVPSFIKKAQPISSMTVWQGRDVYGNGRGVSMTREGEGTTFFVKDAGTVLDGDPIDRVIAGADASTITSLTVFGSVCVALTDGKVQYELSAAEALSISTLNSKAGYKQRVGASEPVLAADRLFIVAPASEGSSPTATLLEADINEDVIQTLYENVGQHVPGYIDPDDVDDIILVSIPSAGKVLLCEKGGTRIFAYQTAYVDDERRQKAWSTWDIGGTIHAACDLGESVMLLVERSGKYMLESWRPEPKEEWPGDAQRMDGRVSVTGGAFSAGVTTFTMPTNVPATGIDTVVKADGTTYTATPISSTQFTVATDLAGITVTAGRSYDECYVRLSRPFPRDSQGVSYIPNGEFYRYVTITASDLTKVTAEVAVDSITPEVWPFDSVNDDPNLGRAWTNGPANRTTIDIILSGVAPASVGTLELEDDSVPFRR